MGQATIKANAAESKTWFSAWASARVSAAGMVAGCILRIIKEGYTVMVCPCSQAIPSAMLLLLYSQSVCGELKSPA